MPLRCLTRKLACGELNGFPAGVCCCNKRQCSKCIQGWQQLST
jgi:hypothetical protein